MCKCGTWYACYAVNISFNTSLVNWCWPHKIEVSYNVMGIWQTITSTGNKTRCSSQQPRGHQYCDVQIHVCYYENVQCGFYTVPTPDMHQRNNTKITDIQVEIEGFRYGYEYTGCHFDKSTHGSQVAVLFCSDFKLMHHMLHSIYWRESESALMVLKNLGLVKDIQHHEQHLWGCNQLIRRKVPHRQVSLVTAQ